MDYNKGMLLGLVWLLSSSLEASSFWRESALLSLDQKMKCEVLTNPCQAKLCTLKTAQYKNPVMVILPKEALTSPTLRIHFHGHTESSPGVALTGTFDKDLTTLTKAFGMNVSACGNQPSIVVIPWSYGKSSDFDEKFVDATSFEEWIKPITQTLELEHAAIYLSAHSGGGRTLRRILNTINTTQLLLKDVTFYDGFYRDEDVKAGFDWIKKNQEAFLHIVTLGHPGAGILIWSGEEPSPFTYTRTEWLFNHWPKLKSKEIKFHNKNVYQLNYENVDWTILETTHFNHWTLMRDSWNQF